MFVRVHLAYRQGVPLPSTWSQPAHFGQLFAERVRGVLRLELWPLEFAPNTKATTSVRPLCLWRPEVTAVGDFGLSFTGLEKDGGRWVAQRWLCEPRSLAALQKERDEQPGAAASPEKQKAAP